MWALPLMMRIVGMLTIMQPSAAAGRPRHRSHDGTTMPPSRRDHPTVLATDTRVCEFRLRRPALFTKGGWSTARVPEPGWTVPLPPVLTRVRVTLSALRPARRGDWFISPETRGRRYSPPA
jgi:hypothetical protein